MMNIVEAVNDALVSEMTRDERVLVLGEDVASGGAFGATANLARQFGSGRAVDTPIGEGGIVGTAIGMALAGARLTLRLFPPLSTPHRFRSCGPSRSCATSRAQRRRAAAGGRPRRRA